MLYFNRNGVWFTIPIAKDAVYSRELLEKQIHTSLLGLQNLKDRSPDLDQMRFEKQGEYVIKSVFGRDDILIHPPSITKGRPRKIVETVSFTIPVLGILLNQSGDTYNPVCDLHPFTTDPKETPDGWVRSDAVKAVAGDSGYEDGLFPYSIVQGRKALAPPVEHDSLNHVGQDDNQYHNSTYEQVYTPVADDIIYLHEFAYRTIWDPFGNAYYVDPIIFTCGNYVPETDLELEVYGGEPKNRASDWDTNETFELIVEGFSVTSGVYTTHHPYTLTYLRDYVIPDDLYVDDWPEEMIARCCYPPGTYKLYSRASDDPIYEGVQIYHGLGEGTSAVNGYALGEFGACLYHYYLYQPGSLEYYYELRFFALGKTPAEDKEFVVYSGTSTPDHIPDDIYESDFKVFDLNGSPVAVFCYYHYFGDSDNLIKYGIYYDGELYSSEEYLMEGGAYNTHDIQGYRAKEGLDASGFVTAWGAKCEETREIEIQGD